TAPATCGADSDVPDSVCVPPPNHGPVIVSPGANMSTTAPMLLVSATQSPIVLAPMVSASPTLAGEKFAASVASPPAATANGTPAAIVLRTALSSTSFAGPPRLRFATDGPDAFWAIQSIPATTPSVVPLPPSSSTRTGTIVIFL